MSGRAFELATIPGETYPEVVAAGNLAAALAIALAEKGSSLLPVEPNGTPGLMPACARVSTGDRLVQTALVKRHHSFDVEFWMSGVRLAEGELRQMDEVADACVAWLTDGCSVASLSERHPRVPLWDKAVAYEAGPTEFLRWQRARLRDVFVDDGDEERIRLLDVTAEVEPLSALLPYAGTLRISFSDCTGFPYAKGFPSIRPLTRRHYEVENAGGEVIALAPLEDCIHVLCRNLPRGPLRLRHGCRSGFW